MTKFGILKSKILVKLTESYQKQDKNSIKLILSLIKEDKNFREMHLFYEDVENKYFDDVNDAKLYVEQIIPILNNKFKISKFHETLYKKFLGDVTTDTNELYDNLDQLSEDDNLTNIDKKILAKKKLIEYLTTKKKEYVIDESIEYTTNDKLLHSVLSNNFNVLYDNILDEQQKKELKEYISMSEESIESEIIKLKEDVLSKVDELLNENTNTEISKKLDDVKREVFLITPSRVNLYKLKQLKNGLN